MIDYKEIQSSNLALLKGLADSPYKEALNCMMEWSQKTCKALYTSRSIRLFMEEEYMSQPPEGSFSQIRRETDEIFPSHIFLNKRIYLLKIKNVLDKNASSFTKRL